jgi:NAD-dependent SIR2 family protein deacetylase
MDHPAPVGPVSVEPAHLKPAHLKPVPVAPVPVAEAACRLRAWLEGKRRVFVLTGAGCSTHSGIPDYRDTDGAWKRTPPMTFQAFIGAPDAYRRYWARSFAGWPRFADAEPNAAHHALSQWQRSRALSALVTQNVDGLHQRAGSRDVIDLHGRLDVVVCLGCAARQTRTSVQAGMGLQNQAWSPARDAPAPDGDTDIDDEAVARFEAPACEHCGGLLKPDVVFFGENVPRVRYLEAQEALQGSDALLVVGSSLMVYSGYRFARSAHEAGLPIAIVNRGRTRADALATLRIDADCAGVLKDALAPGHGAVDIGQVPPVKRFR